MKIPPIEFEDEWLPESFLSILNITRDETSWNRLLCYFLNPTISPFRTKIIERFLNKLKENKKLDIENFDLENVKIERENLTPNNNQLDILIKSSTWFIWIELKVDSKEGDQQTIRYFKDDYLSKYDRKENYEHHEYIYIAPPGNEPESDEFQHVTWKNIVNWLDIEWEEDEVGKKQLDIFLHSIEYELGLDETKTKKRGIKYLNYWYENSETLNKLENLRKNFKNLVEGYSMGKKNRGIKPWWEPFLENPPERWNENWNVNKESKWGQIYLTRWKIDENEPPLHLEHYPNKKEHFKNGMLNMHFHWEPSGQFTKELREEIRSKIKSSNEMIDLLDKYSISVKDKSDKVILKKEYRFEIDENPIKSRTKVLRSAFDEFEPATQKIDEFIQSY